MRPGQDPTHFRSGHELGLFTDHYWSFLILEYAHIQHGVESGGGVCTRGEEEVAVKWRAADTVDRTMVGAEGKLDG